MQLLFLLAITRYLYDELHVSVQVNKKLHVFAFVINSRNKQKEKQRQQLWHIV